MDASLRRGFAAEGLGTFAIVYFGAGALCINFLTTTGTRPGAAPLHATQPGLLGVAVAQGAVLTAVLAVTTRLSGGFLNPAITLMLWVFNRLDNKRTALFLLAQMAGAFLAGGCLRYTFDDTVLREARLGTPHLNPEAFPQVDTGSVIAGTSVELVLTFFLVFAIFGTGQQSDRPEALALPAGLVMIAGGIVAGPLTGAAGNPARWFGVVVWEHLAVGNPWGDTFVYLAGPILGALLAGLVVFRLLFPEPAAAMPAKQPGPPAKRK
jgi:MIP family channel proteins